MSDQLPLFEGYRPQHARVSISGGFATVDGATIPKLSIGKRVRFLVEGEVTAVKHQMDKNGDLERQHVVVLDGFTADENYPSTNGDTKVTISTPDGKSVDTTTGEIQRLAGGTSDDAA